MFLAVVSAVFFGWALGANDAANVYGTAVASDLVKFKVAVASSVIFILIGAVFAGSRVLETISSLSSQTVFTAVTGTIAAALTMTIMTLLGIPVSSSQAMMGAIFGVGMFQGTADWSIFLKIVVCWVATPVGAAVGSFFLYRIISIVFARIKTKPTQNFALKIGAIAIGAYGSFALGANDVANVIGPFAGIMPVKVAVLMGGISIGLGVITFGKRVMYTVGKQIITLDHFAAVIAVLSMSSIVWMFTLLGIPASTSQAIVGAVVGAGFAGGTKDINLKVLKKIVLGWVQTPLVAGLFSFFLCLLLDLVIKIF
ncbi:Phosphate/sulfate permease [Mesotoga infera]|uniref:Phosphate/sulfate permease n=1 Tax=Mesotoga infera TaxID=1236046 RepID=A0A7Z7LGI0_9BACT|nr:inorganic phosphate transporter [Mesotoga infera]SSC13049.1 Phosphate/sulfate permease [Mesotoga infera]